MTKKIDHSRFQGIVSTRRGPPPPWRVDFELMARSRFGDVALVFSAPGINGHASTACVWDDEDSTSPVISVQAETESEAVIKAMRALEQLPVLERE